MNKLMVFLKTNRLFSLGMMVSLIGFGLMFTLALAQWRLHKDWGYFVIWGVGLMVILCHPLLHRMLRIASTKPTEGRL